MPVVTQQELTAISVALLDLSKRVGALTMPTQSQPESPNGMKIMPGSGKLVIKTVEWEVTPAGKLLRNGILRPESSMVTVGMRNMDTFVQGTSFGGFYRAAGVEGDWSTSSGSWTDLHGIDPSVSIIPPGVPLMASKVGYTFRSFGPNVTIDSNWFKTAGDNVVQKGTGVVCSGGSNTYNAHLRSMIAGGKGIAFGGGAYFEANLLWQGDYNGYGMPGSTGWPSWWTNSAEADAGATTYSAELDIMEAWGNNRFGSAVHAWYGGAGLETVIGRDFTPPNNFDHAKPHKYGALWVPATPVTRGYVDFYFDGELVTPYIMWDQYTGALPPKDVSVLDTGHQGLILGSGKGNPMEVLSVEVWQRPNPSNLVRA